MTHWVNTAHSMEKCATDFLDESASEVVRLFRTRELSAFLNGQESALTRVLVLLTSTFGLGTLL